MDERTDTLIIDDPWWTDDDGTLSLLVEGERVVVVVHGDTDWHRLQAAVEAAALALAAAARQAVQELARLQEVLQQVKLDDWHRQLAELDADLDPVRRFREQLAQLQASAAAMTVEATPPQFQPRATRRATWPAHRPYSLMGAPPRSVTTFCRRRGPWAMARTIAP